MLGHGADNEGTDHSRQGSHSVGDPHENAGVARSDVQVVDIKTYGRARTSASEWRTEFLRPLGKCVAGPQAQPFDLL